MCLLRKTAFFVLLLSITSPALGQRKVEKVDREEIKHAISDPALSTFYPKLVARFNKFDTSLTNADFRYLYFGYVFQKEYKGGEPLAREEVRSAKLAKDNSRTIALLDSALTLDPVSLWANAEKAMLLSHIDSNGIAWRQYAWRFRKLRSAILWSGDGLSCESSFYTICVNDEYHILDYFEITSKAQSLAYPCDYFQITPTKDYNAKNIYFDTSESLRYTQKLLDEK